MPETNRTHADITCGKIYAMDDQPLLLDIEELLKRMVPPATADSSFDASPVLAEIKIWHKRNAASLLAGLQTDPAYHANDIRFDWLQRLVLSKADGKKKPGSKDLQRALNVGLGEANVLNLEDPIEDTFCDLISTKCGNFRILLGRWECAAAYTQTLIDAFEALPEGGQKSDALHATYALLRVSDEVCRRAGVDRGTPSGGEPMASIRLPSKERLAKMVRRVRFTAAELNDLDLDLGELDSFLLREEFFPFLSDRQIGDTPLEFYPLLTWNDGVEVVSPTNLSIAVRAALISVAKAEGIEDILQQRLLEKQEKFSEATAFWPTGQIKLTPPNHHNLRASVCQYDHGSYLHIIQIPTLFDGFPEMGFASFRKLSDETEKFIAQDIEQFWAFLEQQGDCRRSATVLLLSGWGSPHGVAPPINEERVPGHWQFLPLSFADGAVLGACNSGKFRDVLRLIEQAGMLERDGFTMTNPNGLLNLFGFWKMTKGNIVPEHLWDMVPPCNLMIGVDELLKPRLEALQRQDRRALPLPEGGCKVVQRKDWNDENLLPIYASVDDLHQSRLTGAVSFEGRTIWIESDAREGLSRHWQYQVWNAVLQWLAWVGPKIVRSHPALIEEGCYRVLIALPDKENDERVRPPNHTTPQLSDCLVVQRDDAVASVEIKEGWSTYLTATENHAEIELVAATLEGILDRAAIAESREKLVEYVRIAVGSGHWRWLHAQEPDDLLPRLAGQGLVAGFKPISFSAH